MAKRYRLKPVDPGRWKIQQNELLFWYDVKEFKTYHPLGESVSHFVPIYVHSISEGEKVVERLRVEDALSEQRRIEHNVFLSKAKSVEL